MKPPNNVTPPSPPPPKWIPLLGQRRCAYILPGECPEIFVLLLSRVRIRCLFPYFFDEKGSALLR